LLTIKPLFSSVSRWKPADRIDKANARCSFSLSRSIEHRANANSKEADVALSADSRANVRRVDAAGEPADTTELLSACANFQYSATAAAAHVDFDAQAADPGADDLRASRQSF